MLARRRQRREEQRKLKSVESTAREVVRVELEQWRNRLTQARKDTEEQRAHYQQQEKELREQYEKARQQLNKRRSTLLATTSLIPYTKTIQETSNFRVPASLLTLQARLCLHVHCLCVHEELLLRTKEQGWDTIAWMEDVSRQLRLLMHKHITNLQTNIQDVIQVLQKIDPDFEVPGSVKGVLQKIDAITEADVEEPLIGNNNLEAIAVNAPASTGSVNADASKDESFMDFLQRYEQRKAHQEKADQMRLAEFRSRGNEFVAGAQGRLKNPFTARRAIVGTKLKNYASKLFQNNASSPGGRDDGMDESMKLDDINSSHVSTSRDNNFNPYDSTIHEGSNSSLAGPAGGRRQSWIPFRRSGSAQLSQSESNLDTSWTLGSSLRGLRNRGYRRPFGGTGMETQAELAELGESGNHGEENGEKTGKEEAGEDSLSHAEHAVVGTSDNQLVGDCDDKKEIPSHMPTTSENTAVEGIGRAETNSSSKSPLKNKLKAPGIHKMCESARF